MEGRRLQPIHPGQIVMEEFVAPTGMPLAAMAAVAGLDPKELDALVRGDVYVSAQMAQALAQALGTTPQFWLNLQQDYVTRIGRAGHR